MAKVTIETSTLSSIGSAIRGKEGSTELIPTADMATRITNLPSGSDVKYPDKSYFQLTGDWDSKLYNDKYGFTKGVAWIFDVVPGELFDFSKATGLKDIFTGGYTFQNPLNLNIEINPSADLSQYNFTEIFYGTRGPEANIVITLPQNTGAKKEAKLSQIFRYSRLHKVSLVVNNTEQWKVDLGSLFNQAGGVRTVDLSKSGLEHSISGYNHMFYYCYVLDEVKDLPVIENAITAGNWGEEIGPYLRRLKDFTFKHDKEYTLTYMSDNYSKNVFDLGYGCGYGLTPENAMEYAGIGPEKEIKNQEDYERLKNDPDAFTQLQEYSRYNHDSFVRTLKSLPRLTRDRMTIQVEGKNGSKTDGGAIENLTPEESALATSKGWTIAFN